MQPHQRPMTYLIRVDGHLDEHWADWFGATNITREDDGDTVLTCSVVDQAALHGLLKKARDSGLVLVAVNATVVPNSTKEITE